MKKTILLSLTLLPALLFAHEGHGPVDSGLAHYLLSPLHLTAILSAAIIGIGGYLYIKNKKRNNA